MAASVFDESTLSALKFYGLDRGTIDFIGLIYQLWTILNVKSRFKGDHKRNDLAKPIIMDDSRIDLLPHYAQWFERWKDSSSDFQHALSKQTFLALSATCNSLADLSEYLLHEKGLNYILLGKFQTDQLERRFGRYRQLHGGNYYISVRQLLQSEKKIKVSAALLHDKLNFQALSQMSDSDSSESHAVEPLYISLPNFEPEAGLQQTKTSLRTSEVTLRDL